MSHEIEHHHLRGVSEERYAEIGCSSLAEIIIHIAILMCAWDLILSESLYQDLKLPERPSVA